MQKMWNDDAHIRAYIRAKMRNMKNMKRTKTTKKVLDDSEEVFNGGKYIFEKLLMMVITYIFEEAFDDGKDIFYDGEDMSEKSL